MGDGLESCPHAVREMVATRGVRVLSAPTWRQARDPALLGEADAVLLCEPDRLGPAQREGWYRQTQLLADALRVHRLTGLLLSPGVPAGLKPDESVMVVPAEASTDELWGRLSTLRLLKPLLCQMDEEVAAMQRLGKTLNQQFVEVDQELRLASRLQRDFLPRRFPEVRDVRFAALYRPASWVSGDLYDVVRLDETHIGFYLADAVGHGIAAGLLTMFIKQAVAGKAVHDGGYSILPPGDVLARLNDDLARQDLPNCQFVTACYGCVDTATHEVPFARGGHPHPIHVSAAGRCTEVHAVGGLLGVFPEESFAGSSLKLEPGEKLILYSDGLEETIIASRDRARGLVEFSPAFLEVVGLDARTLVDQLSLALDRTEGSLTPVDDMTLLAVERLPD